MGSHLKLVARALRPGELLPRDVAVLVLVFRVHEAFLQAAEHQHTKHRRPSAQPYIDLARART